MTTTITISATDSAAIRRDDEVITPFYKVGSTESYYNEWYYRGLMFFDLSIVPTNAQIISGRFELYVKDNLGANGGTYSIHRVQLYWIGSQVTRWKRTTSAGWSSIGGNFDSTSSAGLWMSASESAGYKYFNLETAGVVNAQNIVSGSVQNYGFLIKNGEDANRAHGFDYATNKPKLQITYKINAKKYPVMFFTS